VAHWRNIKKSKSRLSDRYGWIAAMWVKYIPKSRVIAKKQSPTIWPGLLFYLLAFQTL